jgi:hypothetical protein
MDFNVVPSAHWQWFGIITGIAGFVLAAMAIQLIWRKPKLSFHYTKSRSEHSMTLQCHISHEPARGLLNFLEGSRQQAHLTVSVAVSESGSNKPIVEFAKLLINQHSPRNAVAIAKLPPAWPAIIWPFKQKNDSIAYLNDDFGEIELKPGYYDVELLVISEQRKKVSSKNRIHVGKTIDELRWD